MITLVGQDHPTIWKLIDKLRKEDMEERALERYGAISTINFTPIERSSIVERILLKRESRLQFSATAIQQKPFLPLLKFNL